MQYNYDIGHISNNQQLAIVFNFFKKFVRQENLFCLTSIYLWFNKIKDIYHDLHRI